VALRTPSGQVQPLEEPRKEARVQRVKPQTLIGEIRKKRYRMIFFDNTEKVEQEESQTSQGRPASDSLTTG
jgi:hypothetical protein